MPNKKTDSRGFATNNQDIERDIAGKGGPALGTGNPDDAHGVSHPYDEDLQTQIASKSRKKDPLAKPAKTPVK
ncbi:MAG: hypothetical protein JO301_00355 [Chitinophagaceae bacterium]|nr:hypothetical protein [Chitinophagaceae bacterium]